MADRSGIVGEWIRCAPGARRQGPEGITHQRVTVEEAWFGEILVNSLRWSRRLVCIDITASVAGEVKLNEVHSGASRGSPRNLASVLRFS